MDILDEVIVTGASGFIGGFVCEAVLRSGSKVRRFSRSPPQKSSTDTWVAFDPLAPSDCSVFEGARAVIHLAGRAHVLKDESSDAREEYFKANVEASTRIARLARKAGVQRLVFVSSIGVNGNSCGTSAFNETSVPNPVDLYAVSKHEAEHALCDLCDKSGLELVIVRPPLVYGPGNPGNFLRLLELADSGLPLPIGAFNNLKSLIYVENLASALVECARRPAAAGQTYLVSDGHDVSTVELVRQLRLLMQRPPRVMKVPVPLLEALCGLAGKAKALEKFTSTLAVDGRKIRRDLNWNPPVHYQEGLRRTVEWFISEGRQK